MNILVTGATGFIGSHLIQKLSEHEVYVIVRHTTKESVIPKNVKVVNADILDIHSLHNAVKIAQPEIVIHTAALTPVRKSFDNPHVFSEVNYFGTMNMVHAALKSPCLKRFIYASTAEVYTPETRYIFETDELTGSTPYGVSKVAAELYVRMAGQCYGLSYIILRSTNTYGRKSECGYFIEKVVTTMLESNKLVLSGDPNVMRDFMYVDDHVSAYLAAIRYSGDSDIFNVSPMCPHSIDVMVKLIAKWLGWHDGEVQYHGDPRPYDPPCLALDSSKARKLLGWQPTVTLEQGIRKVAEYWRGKL